METFELLLYIEQKTGVDSSTNKIAKETGISQQTISRKLIEMEKNGLIRRDISQRGLKIYFTDKGYDLLKEKYTMLNSIFKKEKIKGTVVNGIGEGSFYIKKYNKKIKESLGFNAYPGTLNINIDEKTKSAILKQNAIMISSFKTKERSYGFIKCYKARINNTDAAIILPERTRHPENIIEIISPVYLRKKLNLKDNSIVEVEL